MDSRQKQDLYFEPLVPDSPEAVEFGYSSARFSGCLRRKNRSIFIWQIFSKEPGKGHFTHLVKKILDAGYTVQIPTPIGKMAEIVRHLGFTPTCAYSPELELYEVWVKEPARSKSTREPMLQGPVEKGKDWKNQRTLYRSQRKNCTKRSSSGRI